MPKDKQISITAVLPTANNVVSMVHENTVSNLLRKQSSDIVLPSLYQRAFIVTYELGEIYATNDVPEEE